MHMPERYASLKEENRGIRTFGGRELDAVDRIHRHVARGGLALLEGSWSRINALYGTMRRRCHDGVELSRLMVRAQGDTLPDLAPVQQIPFLHLLLGEKNGPADFLVALDDLLKIRTNMETKHAVDALGASLTVHDNVLVPRSQPLIHLLRQALEAVAPDLPAEPTVLDMGCGSGVCALLAARVMPTARVTATDHLPEAVATARINVDQLVSSRMIRQGAVAVAEPGDLFETLGAATYDLVIFNAPWVAAPARNRAETALNDAGQQTVRRFLAGAAERLNPGGRVILGYADHSGPNAIARLDRFMAEAGLALRQRHADRIKTHRQNRAWQAIYAYELAHA